MFYNLKRKLLTVFGDIKYSLIPPMLYYCPVTFKVTGFDTRHAMHSLRAGDLIQRGYSSYLDGIFIPGKFSHTGIYVGDGKVIHAIAEGVVQCDIIDYLRCDRFCILRLVSGDKALAEAAVERAKKYAGMKTQYDFNFEEVVPVLDNRLYCHELAAACYPTCDIKRRTPKWLWGLVRAKPTFLAESILESPDFHVIHELA
jgi:hypothetical protein